MVFHRQLSPAINDNYSAAGCYFSTTACSWIVFSSARSLEKVKPDGRSPAWKPDFLILRFQIEASSGSTEMLSLFSGAGNRLELPVSFSLSPWS